VTTIARAKGASTAEPAAFFATWADVAGWPDFDHTLGKDEDGRTTVEVGISMTGPLRGLWMKIMGGDLAKSVQHDLDNLIATAEKRA